MSVTRAVPACSLSVPTACLSSRNGTDRCGTPRAPASPSRSSRTPCWPWPPPTARAADTLRRCELTSARRLPPWQLQDDRLLDVSGVVNPAGTAFMHRGEDLLGERGGFLGDMSLRWP